MRGDGFPVAGGHACFLILTLGNFGKLSKTVSHNFIIGLAEVNEKNHENVYHAFSSVMETLNSWNKPESYLTLF